MDFIFSMLTTLGYNLVVDISNGNRPPRSKP